MYFTSFNFFWQLRPLPALSKGEGSKNPLYKINLPVVIEGKPQNPSLLELRYTHIFYIFVKTEQMEESIHPKSFTPDFTNRFSDTRLEKRGSSSFIV